jgi:cbb3-type cytochrome oxidase maturation protein
MQPMEVIYGLIPGMILLGLGMVGVFFWAARSGQYDDLEGSANRILLDEDEPTDAEQREDGGDPAGPAKGARRPAGPGADRAA